MARTLGEVLRKKPYFASVLRIAGARDPYISGTISEMLSESVAPNFVGFSCQLRPRSERDRLAYQYVEDLRQELDEALQRVPGARVFFTPEIGGSTTDDPIQIDLVGSDMGQLRDLSQAVQEALRAIPTATDVRDNLGQVRIQARFEPRREILARLGIDEADLSEQIRLCTSFEKCGKFRRPGTADDYDILLGTYWRDRPRQYSGPATWHQLKGLSVLDGNSVSVPLACLAKVTYHEVDQAIVHKSGARCVTVKAKTRGATAAEVLAKMRPVLEEMQKTWPSGYHFEIAGEAEQSSQSHASVGRVLLLCLLLVYAVLVLLFGSFLQPLMILSSVVFGLTGVFWGFWLLDLPFSFTASIGITSLIGINVNDAIVMVDTINRHRKSGLPIAKAAARGAAERLRPIVSTTVTTTLALLPLLSHPGWRPLCMAVILGECASTPLCLLLIPCWYRLLVFRRQEALAAGESHSYGTIEAAPVRALPTRALQVSRRALEKTETS